MSLSPLHEDRLRSALLTLDLHRLARLARSHVPEAEPADPREAHAWVDVMLRAPRKLHRVVGSCTADELRRMCRHVGLEVDPQDHGVQPILAYQLSGALGLHAHDAEPSVPPLPAPPLRRDAPVVRQMILAADAVELIHSALVAGAAGPLPVSTEYPPSTIEERTRSDAIVRDALDSEVIGKVSEEVRRAIEAQRSLADAHRLCLAFVAVHDQAASAADALERAAYAELETFPAAYYFRGLPDLEVFFRAPGFIARLAAAGTSADAVSRVRAALEEYRRALMQEIRTRDRSRDALEARLEAHQNFLIAFRLAGRHGKPKSLQPLPPAPYLPRPPIPADPRAEILASLPTLSRLIFRENDRHGRTVEQIAEVTDVPRDGVVRIINAVRSL